MQSVRASGTPYQRGALIGEAFAEATARSVAFNRRYLATHGLDPGQLEAILEPYLQASMASVSHLVDQVRHAFPVLIDWNETRAVPVL